MNFQLLYTEENFCSREIFLKDLNFLPMLLMLYLLKMVRPFIILKKKAANFNFTKLMWMKRGDGKTM